MLEWFGNIKTFSMIRKSPLFDGTISEFLNTLNTDEGADLHRYDEMTERQGENKLDYIQMKIRDFRTRDVENYVGLANDPARWEVFEREVMDRYFNDHIDLFPFKPGKLQTTDPDRRNLPELDFNNPAPFHYIQKEMIERRFAGGELNDIGERDLRDAVSCLRYVFVRNFWHLVVSRRRIGLDAVLVLALIIAGFLGIALLARSLQTDHGSLAKGVMGLGTASALAAMSAVWFNARHMFRRHTAEYITSIQATCNSLSRALNLRLQNLILIIPLFFHKIDKSKMELKNAGKLDDWPMDVKKWSKLAFWIDARVEHIELYMQVQMWRIRRMHFGMRWIGRKLSAILQIMGPATLALGTSAALYVLHAKGNGAGSQPWLLLGPMALIGVLSIGLAFELARRTYTMHTPDISVIETTLKTKAMQGYRDVRLHEQFATFLFQEKMNTLHEEDKHKR
jgi:hypothetical protein